ncbi:hypothetical protein N0V82_009247 [Gnomoniopsis sp. IMI 355080]|nr:hypothetical protein N0V82_009247 [Gnomoniopsis sp. IMI 355080]
MSSDELPQASTSPDMISDTNANAIDADNVTAAAPERKPDGQRDSRLATVPQELLDLVCRILPTPAFNNLRLTCRLMRERTFPDWSTAFFKKKQFMITAFSLQALVDISRHPTLGPCMTHLVIGLDNLRSIGQQTARTLDEYQQYQDACDAQELLLDTGSALKLLTTALLNLPNLHNIDVRNFNSHTRYRDSFRFGIQGGASTRLCATWKSYGYSELPQWSRHVATPNRPLTGNHHHGCNPGNFVNRVVRILLAALGQRKKPIRGLEVLIRVDRDYVQMMALTDSGFAVSPMLNDETSTKLPFVLSSLTKLHLDLSLGLDFLSSAGPYRVPIPHPCDMPKSAEEVSDPCSTNLRRFLALTPNLTWLRLNNRGDTLGSAITFLSWLALNPENPFGPDVEARWGNANPKPVSLPLRKLELGTMTLNTTTLDRLVNKFDKLECLTLRHVHLQPVDGQRIRNDPIVSVWATFFRKLLTIAPNLKQLFLTHISESIKPNKISKEAVLLYPARSRDGFELTAVDKPALEALAENTWLQSAWRSAHQLAPVQLLYRTDGDDSSSEGDLDLSDAIDEDSESDGE